MVQNTSAESMEYEYSICLTLISSDTGCTVYTTDSSPNRVVCLPKTSSGHCYTLEYTDLA